MSRKQSKLHIVGIGASAGGLDAIQRLFDNIPPDTGMAFVIIQHLSPDFVSLMPELLAKHTEMKIYTSTDKQELRPNSIYLNQRNKNLHLKGNKLYLLDKGPKQNLNLPIDIFFHTLGEEYKENSIGIILSGTGSDGSKGIKSIKENGGVTIVQEPTESQFDGMPRSAMATNQVDYILPAKEIAAELIKLTKKPVNFELNSADNKGTSESYFNEILIEVQKYCNINFREYKKNTLQRRLEKRMHIRNIDEIFDYLTYVKSNEEEKNALMQDFLIGVTQFFRDDEAFKTIKNIVIPEICKSKSTSDVIRVWTAGCSSGEEVYSLAILLDEYIRTNNINIDFKIFATDIDERAIQSAKKGVYYVNSINEIEPNYLDKYFIKAGDKIQVVKRIREKIVFSKHNLMSDPPFIKLDLITCRNLLIYLNSTVQKKIMNNFQFSLLQKGYLFLGSSESLGNFEKFYKVIDQKWKIFQNITESRFRPSQSSPTAELSIPQ